MTDHAAALHPALPPDRVILPVANLRDIGGLPTADGRHVRRGRLFRSGHLHDLAPDALDTLRSLGLRTIVDLRRPVETEQQPSPELPGAVHVPISVSADDNDFAVLVNNLTDPVIAARAPELAAGYNRAMVVDSIERWRPVFATAVDADRHPLLFHCTAGKDRTGFMAAVLLRLLGVEEELVIADYLLTNEVRRPWAAERLAAFEERVASMTGTTVEELGEVERAAIRAVVEVAPGYLRAALDAVPETFGTWDEFRRRGLGIDDAAFAAFAGAVLE